MAKGGQATYNLLNIQGGEPEGLSSQQRGNSTRRNTSIVVALAAATLCALVVWFGFEQRSLGRPIKNLSRFTEQSNSNWRDLAAGTTGSTCILHASFGEWSHIADVTVPTKLNYAQKHGYRLYLVDSQNYTELQRGRFLRCLDGASLAGRDMQTVTKFCTLWIAFADGCTAALWTDADAVIQPGQGSLDTWLSNPADVAWSSAGHRTFCQPRGQDSDGLDSLARFASCLNSGAFIMKRTPWSWDYLHRILTMAASTRALNCSTSSLNRQHFDQCMYNDIQKEQDHVGDQCVIACEAMRNIESLKHFVLDRADDPRPLQIAVFAHDVDRGTFAKPKQPLVINCAAADNTSHRLDCVTSIARA